MKNNTQLFYDFDKCCMVQKPRISKNLLNAQYTDIIRSYNNNNLKKNMYLHSAHKTDTYYEKLYNKNNVSKEYNYHIDRTLINLPYSEKIKKWKEMI